MQKKSIIKNYLYNLVYQILILVIPLITTPYLSKTLGASSIGIYSFTLSIATYFILFGSLGIAMYGRREIAYFQDDINERSKTFFEILIVRTITLGISMIIFYFTFASHGEYSIYYKVLLLEILSNILDISWFFQGLEEFKKTVTRNIIVKIISVISIFLFVKTIDDLIIYFVIYVLSNLLGNISMWFYLPKYINKINVRQLNIIKHVKPTILLFIPQIAMQVYTVLDKTMIGWILNDMSEVGNYEQSQKIVKLAMTIVTSLGTVIIPRISNTYAKKNDALIRSYLEKTFNFVWILGTPIMFGIMAISFKFVPWFLGEGFEKSIILLILGAPLVLVIGLNNVSGMQYLIPTKKQNIFTKSVVIGAIFNFFTNLLLINIFKSVGAIIASTLAETVILSAQLIYMKKDIPLIIAFQSSIKPIFCGLIMFFVTFFVGHLLEATIITTFIQILIGTLCYFSLLYIFKDKFFINMIDKLKMYIKKSTSKTSTE